MASARPAPTERLWLAALRRLARRRALVLGYHGVDRTPRQDDLFLLQLRPERFRAQLETMIKAGFSFVTVAELAARAGGGEPPPGLAAVSFDDGLRNNLTVALPILEDLGIKATVYVVTGWLGGQNPWTSGPTGRTLTAEEVRRLDLAGWEIGAHTRTHADLSTLGYDDCLQEIRGSSEEIERITGRRVRTAAYPFGRYGAEAIRAARDSGLEAAVTTGSGSWAPFELTRAMMGAADPFPVSMLKLTDRYEPLLSSPPLRAARSQSKRIRGWWGENRRRG